MQSTLDPRLKSMSYPVIDNLKRVSEKRGAISHSLQFLVRELRVISSSLNAARVLLILQNANSRAKQATIPRLANASEVPKPVGYFGFSFSMVNETANDTANITETDHGMQFPDFSWSGRPNYSESMHYSQG